MKLHKLMVVGLVTGLLLAGAAAAQVGVGRPGQVGYFGDEPNVQAAGDLPYNYHNTDNKTSRYVADDNGFGPARLTSPDVVLGANLIANGGAVLVDTAQLFSAVGSGDYILPGVLYQLLAYHGTWQDLNADGVLTDASSENSTYYVDAGPRDCGAHELKTDDPKGTAGLVSYRCNSAGDEWTPVPEVLVVAYITPYVPTESMAWNTLFSEQSEAPDFELGPDPTPEGGRYASPKSGFDFVFYDNSVLETTSIETIAAPAVVADGPRSHVAGPDSLVDTDLYKAIDGTVEGLYQENVMWLMNAEDCDPDHPENFFGENECPRLHFIPDDATDPVDDALQPVEEVEEAAVKAFEESYFPTVGPANARVQPTQEPERDAHDYTEGWHTYLDVTFQQTVNTPAVVTSVSGRAGQISYAGTGQSQAPLYGTVYGVLGVWWDRNADGYIGQTEPVEGCTTPSNCGYDPVPNDYTYAEEWTGTCRPDEGIKHGEIQVDLTPNTDGNAWGDTGVYILADTDEGNYDQRNGYGFNPWNDAVNDAADGSVDRLKVSGTITIRMVCTANGFYDGYEYLVFPTSNLGYSITIASKTFTLAFESLGITNGENVQDTDTIAAWNV